MVEEGRSGKLSEQSEVLLHKFNGVVILNSESFMGTHSTVIEAPPLLCCVVSFPVPAPAFVATLGNKNWVWRLGNEASTTSFPSLVFANKQTQQQPIVQPGYPVQMPFSFLHIETEVCCNRALEKNFIECNHHQRQPG